MNLFYPLSEFYEQSGLPQPLVVRIEGRDIPEPQRSVLVGEHDMTPALEEAYRRNINLRVLRYELRGEVFRRQVVLIPEGHAAPAVFGAIKIYLEHFPAQARRLVLERKQPLGTILRTQGIEHASRPEAYIQVTADAVISSALELSGPCVLYGRRNRLLDSSGHTLARVVEILPPSGPMSARGNGFGVLQKPR